MRTTLTRSRVVQALKTACCAFLTFLAVSSASASADEQPPDVRTYAFNVPAGRATDTLKQVAQQAGMEIMFSAEEPQRVRTPALKGEMPVKVAFLRLLEGTELEAVFDRSSRAVTVRRRNPADRQSTRAQTTAAASSASLAASAENVVRLDPFQVVSSEGGYLQSTSTVATRANRQTIEIPQTISVLTEEFLADTGAYDAGEAISYVGNTFVRDQFTEPGNTIMRGFEREGEVYVDGFRDVTFPRDAAAYDRMEVVKGPPSAVQGRSGSSGLINWVTKKPTFGRDFEKATLAYVSGDYQEMFRAVVDVNRTLLKNENHHLGVRAVAIYQDGESWVDLLKNDKMAIYPSVRWQWKKTEVNIFGGLLRSTTPSRDIGSGPAFFAKEFRDKFTDPALGGAANDPISALNIKYGANPVGPDSLRDDDVGVAVASVSHTFNDIFSVRQAYQFLSKTTDRIWYDPTALTTQVTTSFLGVSGVWVPVARGGNHNVENRHAVQGDFVANYKITSRIQSVTLAGYEWWSSVSQNDTKSLAVGQQFTRVNLAAPFVRDANYWKGRITGITFSSRNREIVETLGYYAQQEFDFFGRFLLQGAWRHDIQDLFRRNKVSGNVTADSEDDTDSVRFGGTVFLNKEKTFAAYAVYSDQKNPQQNRLQYGNLRPGDPRIDDRLIWDPAMELVEFGLKGEFFDRRLSLTAAYFEMTKTGNLNTISNVPMESVGEQVFADVASIADSTNKGWEFAAVGNLGRGVSFLANLSFNDSNEKRVFGTELVNQRIHRVPDYAANVFVKWDLRNGRKNGFILRAGMNTYADFEGTFNGVRTTLTDTFTRYDAGVTYRWNRYSFDLFANNVTDEAIILFRGGPPRTLKFTISSQW